MSISDCAGKAQLLQSRASLQRSQADANLADLTLKRNEELRRINAISQQQLDQVRDADESAHSGLEQTKANIAHDEANVQQFTEQQSWERVVAPFGGKVTVANGGCRSFDHARHNRQQLRRRQGNVSPGGD